MLGGVRRECFADHFADLAESGAEVSICGGIFWRPLRRFPARLFRIRVEDERAAVGQ